MIWLVSGGAQSFSLQTLEFGVVDEMAFGLWYSH